LSPDEGAPPPSPEDDTPLDPDEGTPPSADEGTPPSADEGTPPPTGRPGPRLGTVTAYDAGQGRGTVAEESGCRYPFHATAIADGSRRIEVGTRVAFSTVAGHLGRTEATCLVPIG
jgi:cold shock CspA family protein